MPRLPRPLSDDEIRAAAEEIVSTENARRREMLRPYEDLLASIWLYIPWQYVTKQLTTPQKEMFADAIDASHARSDAQESEPEPHPVERWWRDH